MKYTESKKYSGSPNLEKEGQPGAIETLRRSHGGLYPNSELNHNLRIRREGERFPPKDE